jgi:D-alanyl-D-alanine carboxypeptidase
VDRPAGRRRAMRERQVPREQPRAALRISKLVSYGGGFIFRPVRGATGISLHAWGIAWDFDPDHNQLNTNGRMDRTIVRIFEDHGFFWGGKFQSRKDPMHFQFAINT